MGQEETVCPDCGVSSMVPDWTAAETIPPQASESDRFRLEEHLGTGSFGTVWRAEDTKLDRVVALKVLHPSLLATSQHRERFFREARALAQLRHPGIVTVFEVTELSGSPAIVSECVAGKNLHEWAQLEKPGFQEAAELVIQIAEALEYAGLMGVVHRDIKPANIMVEVGSAGRPRALIVDFGLALRDEVLEKLTVDGELIGTPAYMSPEQAAGAGQSVDRRSDIYSLGVVFYELLCGETPFRGSRFMLVQQTLKDEPRSPRSIGGAIPRDLETICMKAMAKAPGDRYGSGREMAEDLRRYLRGETILARPAGALERALRWCRRNPIVASLLTAVILLLSVVAVGGVVTSIRLRSARNATLENLRQSYLSEAKALRMTHESGRRFAGLEALAKAARIRPSLDLRNEAIACMPLVDLRVERTWPARERGAMGVEGISIDGRFEHFAQQEQAKLVLRRVEDGAAIREWTCPLGQNVVFSSDGRYLTSGWDNDVRIWNVTSGDLVLKTEHPGLGNPFVGHGGHRAIVQVGQQELGLFDLVSRKELKRIPVSATKGHFVFDPSGDRAAVDFATQEPIQIVDLVSGSILGSLSPGGISLGWHPDGRHLAVSIEPDIEIWDAMTGTLEKTLKGALGYVSVADFDPEGRLLASHGFDQRTRVWDCAAGEELVSATGYHLGWSRDGRRLAFANDSLAGIWDVARGDECRTFSAATGEGNGPWSVAIHPNGRLLAASYYDGVRLWDLSLGTELGLLPTGSSHGNQCLAFDRSGGVLLTVSERGAYRWPIAEDSTNGLLRIGPPDLLADAAVTRGRGIAFGPHGEVVVTAWRDSILVISPGHPEANRVFGPHTKVSDAAMSPDGRWVLTGTQFGQGIKIWDARTKRLVRELPGGEYGGGVFDPESRWLFTRASGAGMNLLHTATWESFHLYDERGQAAFSPDGRVLGMKRDLGPVILLNTETREELARLTPPRSLPTAGLAFTPDMGTLVVGCCNHRLLQVWDLRRIRRQLREINLDWEPLQPPLDESGVDSGAYRVEVLPGELAVPANDSVSK